jgi:hypothetical protein
MRTNAPLKDAQFNRGLQHSVGRQYGTEFGKVIDYSVYEDIVKKCVRHYPPDLVEVSNEPDGGFMFMNPTDYATYSPLQAGNIRFSPWADWDAEQARARSCATVRVAPWRRIRPFASLGVIEGRSRTATEFQRFMKIARSALQTAGNRHLGRALRDSANRLLLPTWRRTQPRLRRYLACIGFYRD